MMDRQWWVVRKDDGIEVYEGKGSFMNVKMLAGIHGECDAVLMRGELYRYGDTYIGTARSLDLHGITGEPRRQERLARAQATLRTALEENDVPAVDWQSDVCSCDRMGRWVSVEIGSALARPFKFCPFCGARRTNENR